MVATGLCLLFLIVIVTSIKSSSIFESEEYNGSTPTVHGYSNGEDVLLTPASTLPVTATTTLMTTTLTHSTASTTTTTSTTTPSPFTSEQLRILTKVRSEPGIHLYETIPHKFIAGKKDTCYIRTMPVGFRKHTTYTHVLEYPQVTEFVKFRVESPPSAAGPSYMTEYWVFSNQLTYRVNYPVSASTWDFEIQYNLWPMHPGVHVIQTEVLDNGTFQVSMDGKQHDSTKRNCDGFEDARIHRVVDQNSASLTVFEIHITNGRNSSVLFNQVSEFVAPEAGLFEGASVVWEGEANGEFSVTYKSETIYRKRSASPSLRLVMKVLSGIIHIGLAEEPPQQYTADIKARGIAYELKLSKEFKIRNFTMITGNGVTTNGLCLAP
ncbi:uncharacterized protein LOC135368146 isoform X1 [Ornithodoros turicata]|uniref:uncharacterized protein LOC135368146 isoform X1 n=1 Tax=Ornithodoros turicata TaxID=34597 RepID=UPI00313A4C5A